MMPADLVNAAFTRCPAVESKSLEDFLDPLLDEDLETLAQLPGTPGQVLASQFTYYAKSSVSLTEAFKRDTAQAERLADTVLRLPAANGRRRATASNNKETP